MGWRYEQLTGNTYKDGKLIEGGYSDSLTSKDNPDRQWVKGFGPLPCGTYKIAGHSTFKGPVAIILEQAPEETFGCSEFRVHGEHKYGPAGFVLEGCIVLSLTTRRLISRNSGDPKVVR